MIKKRGVELDPPGDASSVQSKSNEAGYLNYKLFSKTVRLYRRPEKHEVNKRTLMSAWE